MLEKKYLYIQYIVGCLENPFSFIRLFIAFVAKDFRVFIIISLPNRQTEQSHL